MLHWMSYIAQMPVDVVSATGNFAALTRILTRSGSNVNSFLKPD